ncbi:MAG: phosphoglycerate kinase [Phycisphaerales bacterium]|nr:phosphoglycerate kinase [Phycisphaerales bacterium]
MPHTIDLVDPRGKRVFIRADFNVPQAEDGRITDDRRVRLTVPTIESVLSRGGSVVLASHLGRPEGTGFEADGSLAPVAARLRELSPRLKGLRMGGQLASDDASRAAALALKPGESLLLENLRFEKGEKKGDPAFAARLADLADIYVNDAFGCSHRGDASMLALPKAMRAQGKPCVAGMLLEREIKFLSGVIESPVRPFAAIVGGAKVSDKLAALRNLCQRVDTILVGGAMAYTFLKASGVAVGRSRVQDDMLDEARSILALARERGCRIELPTDHVCADALAAGVATRVCVGAIPDGLMGLDIGPDTVRRYSELVAGASTILWNGPVGAFETSPFDAGTVALGKAVAAATARGAISVAGGGDTAAAVEHAGLASGFSHISTGGGASLEMLEGKRFECIDALDA